MAYSSWQEAVAATAKCNLSLQICQGRKEKKSIITKKSQGSKEPLSHGRRITVKDFLGDLNISPMRRRHHPRGTKRGRPRGSTRRGGGHGSSQRVLTPTQTQAATTPLTPTAAGSGTGTGAGTGTGEETSSPQPKQEVSGGGESAAGTVYEEEFTTSPVPSAQSPGMSGKRGPGRPRSKTSTPVSRGIRGAPRARRPVGPLLVPLGRSPEATPPSSSPATSRAASPSPQGGGGIE